MYKHRKTKLSLKHETLRTLTGKGLQNVRGGEPASGPPPCTVVSPYQTCTGCDTEVPDRCQSGNACTATTGGTLWTFEPTK